MWTQVAHNFATMLDQWYYAIARHHANSVYWKTRISDMGEAFRKATFTPWSIQLSIQT